MIFNRLGLLNKNQMGVTLIELIVAVAITGFIVGGMATAIYQVVSGNARNSSHMTAVRQVQTAGYWISRDGQMAQTINTVDDGVTSEVEVLILDWEGWERTEGHGVNERKCFDFYKVRYIYYDSSKELLRYETITTNRYDTSGQFMEDETTVDQNSTFIADHITPIPMLTWDEDNNKLTVPITASVTSWTGDAVEERTYEITPRPSTSD